jgi:molybdenum cofactor synthesis domain-containing protein
VIPLRVEIVCVGNELLIGSTINTNANWLASRVTSLGGEVSTITTVGDNLYDIERGIKNALEMKPRFLITTGGMGPTFDDKTLEGVAQALGQEIKLNQEAMDMVRRKYEAYHREGRMEEVEITPARRKMAILPERADPLPNPVGTAPAIIIDERECKIICLPGVPSEMKAIFDESLAPLIKAEAGEKKFYERIIRIEGIMESAMAPLIDEAVKENPRVYIKSHPKGEERKPHLEIHLSTTGEDKDKAERRLQKAEESLRKLIRERD